MTSTEATSNGSRASLASDADEMSLSAEEAHQTDASVPDGLDVRSDAMAVMQGSIARLRHPAAVAALLVGAGLVVIVGWNVLRRGGPPAAGS